MKDKKFLEIAINSIDKHSDYDVNDILASLIKTHGCKDVIELGVFKGFNSCHLINAMPDDGCFIGIDNEDNRTNEVKQFYQNNYAQFIKKDYITALHDLSSRKVDLIFIDTLQKYDEIRAEFKLAEKLIKPNGLICIHNYYLSDGVNKWIDVLKSYNWFEVLTLKTHNNAGITIIKCL